jgi:hypothetical protein
LRHRARIIGVGDDGALRIGVQPGARAGAIMQQGFIGARPMDKAPAQRSPNLVPDLIPAIPEEAHSRARGGHNLLKPAQRIIVQIDRARGHRRRGHPVIRVIGIAARTIRRQVAAPVIGRVGGGADRVDLVEAIMGEQRVHIDMAGIAVIGVGARPAGDLSGRIKGEAVGIVVRRSGQIGHQLIQASHRIKIIAGLSAIAA